MTVLCRIRDCVKSPLNFLYARRKERSGNGLAIKLSYLCVYESVDPVRHRVIGQVVGEETKDEIVDDIDKTLSSLIGSRGEVAGAFRIRLLFCVDEAKDGLDSRKGELGSASDCSSEE